MIWDDVVEELQADPRVTAGSFFGHPGVKLGPRVFAFEFHGDIVVKLGKEDAAAAVEQGADDGVRYFDPHGGHPMRNWAQFPVADAGDPVAHWIELAEIGKDYVDGEE